MKVFTLKGLMPFADCVETQRRTAACMPEADYSFNFIVREKRINGPKNQLEYVVP